MKGGLNFKRMASSSGFESKGFVRAQPGRTCWQLLTSDLLFGNPLLHLFSCRFGLAAQRFLCMRKCCLPAFLPSEPSPPRAFLGTYYQVGQKLLQFRCDSLPLSIRHVLVGPLVRFGPYSCVLNGQKSVHVTRRK
jgi:hypothetical protein